MPTRIAASRPSLDDVGIVVREADIERDVRMTSHQLGQFRQDDQLAIRDGDVDAQCPARCAARAGCSIRSASNSSTMMRQRRCSSWPSLVSATLRVVRWNRRTPRSSSRRATLFATADGTSRVRAPRREACRASPSPRTPSGIAGQPEGGLPIADNNSAMLRQPGSFHRRGFRARLSLRRDGPRPALKANRRRIATCTSCNTPAWRSPLIPGIEHRTLACGDHGPGAPVALAPDPFARQRDAAASSRLRGGRGRAPRPWPAGDRRSRPRLRTRFDARDPGGRRSPDFLRTGLRPWRRSLPSPPRPCGPTCRTARRSRCPGPPESCPPRGFRHSSAAPARAGPLASHAPVRHLCGRSR